MADDELCCKEQHGTHSLNSNLERLLHANVPWHAKYLSCDI